MIKWQRLFEMRLLVYPQILHKILSCMRIHGFLNVFMEIRLSYARKHFWRFEESSLQTEYQRLFHDCNGTRPVNKSPFKSMAVEYPQNCVNNSMSFSRSQSLQRRYFCLYHFVFLENE